MPSPEASPSQATGRGLDLIVLATDAPHAASLLVDAKGTVALVDGGPLGSSLALLLDLCGRFEACRPDHVLLTPASGGGSEALLFLLAGPDRQPGTPDDRFPRGAFLRIPPLPACNSLACLGVAGLGPGPKLARQGDTLLLGRDHRLRLELAAASPRLIISAPGDRTGPASPTPGAILWGPAPCVLDQSARAWAVADLTRCPAGQIEITMGSRLSAVALLGGGRARCEGLRADIQRLHAAGARVFVLDAETCPDLPLPDFRAPRTQLHSPAHLIVHLETGARRLQVMTPLGRLDLLPDVQE